MQFKISNDSSKYESSFEKLGNFDIGYFSLKCDNTKEHNEDSFTIKTKNNEILVGISDGAGGHPLGAKASNTAIDSLANNFIKNKDHNFLKYIEKSNKDVRALKAGAKTTLAIVYIKKDSLTCHNVGDSEIIYWNSQGKEIYRNIPQSEVGHLIQGGVISQDDSLDHDNRYIVNHLIGDKSLRIESTTKMKLKIGHTILLGSDGLFDNLSHEQLAQIIFKDNIEQAFNELTKICTEQDPESWKKSDDITFCLLRKFQ